LFAGFMATVAIADDQPVLMMWDEFPLTLYNISNRADEPLVIERLSSDAA
jgi:hypothetical protein